MPRIDLQVPYAEKDEAKKLGAYWDAKKKVWYVPNGVDPTPFYKWRLTQSTFKISLNELNILRPILLLEDNVEPDVFPILILKYTHEDSYKLLAMFPEANYIELDGTISDGNGEVVGHFDSNKQLNEDLFEAYKQLKLQDLLGEPNALPRTQPQPLLTIELVPSTCWFSNVRSEVSSDDWNKLKKMSYQKAKYRCEICSGKGSKHPVECHEVWHYDDVNHIQTLSRLIALCPGCHRVKHIGWTTLYGNSDVAKYHLAKVNKWTLEEAREYIQEQFEVWKQRSQYEWKLDISYIEKLGICVNVTSRK